jgi:hypothetical protein
MGMAEMSSRDLTALAKELTGLNVVECCFEPIDGDRYELWVTYTKDGEELTASCKTKDVPSLLQIDEFFSKVRIGTKYFVNRDANIHKMLKQLNSLGKS